MDDSRGGAEQMNDRVCDKRVERGINKPAQLDYHEVRPGTRICIVTSSGEREKRGHRDIVAGRRLAEQWCNGVSYSYNTGTGEDDEDGIGDQMQEENRHRAQHSTLAGDACGDGY